MTGLKETKKTWKISSRRVTMHLKAINEGKPILSAKDEKIYRNTHKGGFSGWLLRATSSKNASSSSSSSSKKKKSASTTSKKKSYKKKTDESTTETQDTYPISSVPSQSVSVYKDDNDGKKDCACWCMGAN